MSEPDRTDDVRSSAPSPLDRLLDLSVFAPLGFLLERNEVFDQLAQTGRRQIAFSRSLGRAALRTLARSAADRPAARRTTSAPHPAPDTAPDTAPATDAGPSEPAIDGYDALTARQVIDIVGRCSDVEAEWIRSAEAHGKQRVTVMRALDRRGGARG